MVAMFVVDSMLLKPRNNAGLSSLEAMLTLVYFAYVFIFLGLPRNPGGIAGLLYYYAFLCSYANDSALLRYGLAVVGVVIPALFSFLANDHMPNTWVAPIFGVVLQSAALIGFRKFQQRGQL
jgi:hypothetical protein